MGVRGAGLILQMGRLGRHPRREDPTCAVCSLPLGSQQKKSVPFLLITPMRVAQCFGVELMSRSIKTQCRQGPVVLSTPQSGPW